MNLLFYVEPHPVRNSYTEWFHIATILTPVFQEYAKRGEINYRIFSNNSVIDKFVKTNPGIITHLQRPTFTESKFIDAQFTLWNETSIKNWLELVEGQGLVAEFYQSAVERMHATLPIDIIFTWSENGALRRFSERTGVPVIFGELGPTRAPFVETMYFDSNGTNGNALFRKKTRQLVEECNSAITPSSQSWLLWSDKKIKNPQNTRSLVDLPSTFDLQMQNILPSIKYIYIPLQLADDLNTLMHSKFKSPKDFLISVLPQIAEAGYAVVIKGHPGSEERAYNMRHEIEALQYAEESGFEVTIIPRKASPSLSAYVLGNASYTLSINSSVSFESMLLGVPALVMGAAAFDANGWLQEKITLCPANQQIDYSAVMDAITAVHMQNVFVPKEIVLSSDYLLGLFKDTVTTNSVEDSSQRVSVSQVDFMDNLFIGTTDFKSSPAFPYIGSISVNQADTVTVYRDKLTITSKRIPASVLLLRLSKIFVGYLEVCNPGDDNSLILQGWAIDDKTRRPPMQLIVLRGAAILSVHRINHHRQDVISTVSNVSTSLCGFKIELKNVKHEDLSLVFVGYDGEGQIIEHIRDDLAFHEV